MDTCDQTTIGSSHLNRQPITSEQPQLLNGFYSHLLPNYEVHFWLFSVAKVENINPCQYLKYQLVASLVYEHVVHFCNLGKSCLNKLCIITSTHQTFVGVPRFLFPKESLNH